MIETLHDLCSTEKAISHTKSMKNLFLFRAILFIMRSVVR